jgi:hypothetical protein
MIEVSTFINKQINSIFSNLKEFDGDDYQDMTECEREKHYDLEFGEYGVEDADSSFFIDCPFDLTIPIQQTRNAKKGQYDAITKGKLLIKKLSNQKYVDDSLIVSVSISSFKLISEQDNNNFFSTQFSGNARILESLEE